MARELYSVEQVAAKLGLHVRTVRNYVRDGRLKAVRIGKQYRVSAEDLEAFTGISEPGPARSAELSAVAELEADRDTADRLATYVLAALAQHLRVYAVDVPGEPGMTVEARPRLGSAAYAEWLDDVLDELGLPRAAFLGVSLGGWWSLDYAVRRPERVGALALLNPSGIGRRKTGPLLKFAVLSLFGDWGR